MGYNRVFGNQRQVEMFKKENKDFKIELIGISKIEQALSYILK